MASHASFAGPSAAASANLILSLIDIATKLASNDDPSKRVTGVRKNEMIPHFTAWRNFSVEQKAKIIDLVLEFYDASLSNPVYDPAAPTDNSFITTTQLRKLSSEFSSQLLEGMTVLRERTEDMLVFSFLLNIDKLSSFGRDSRELARCIEYRLPSMYRDSAALHGHCRLFANAVAATVLDRANLTPFRRNYSGSFKTSFQPFTLRDGAPLPRLVDSVGITRPPIEFHEDLTSEDAAPNLAPAAPNTPTASQRGQSLHRSESSYWAGDDDLDFSSEEVWRALDEAELEAGARVWKLKNQVRSVASSSKKATGSDIDSMLDSISTTSDLTGTTGLGSTDDSNHHVPGIHYPPSIGAAHQFLTVTEAPVIHGATFASQSGSVHSPGAPEGSPVPQAHAQQLGFIVPTGYMLLATPGTPGTPSRNRSTTVPSPRNHATNPSLHNRTTSPPVMGSMVASGSNSYDGTASQNLVFPNPAFSPLGQQTDVDAMTPTKSGKRSLRKQRVLRGGDSGM